MLRGHHRGEVARDVQFGGEFDPRGGGILAGEDRSRVDGLALGEDEGVGLVEGLRRREPLQS